MSKAARWFRSFLSGKGEKHREEENARYTAKQQQTRPKEEEEENKNANQQRHRKQQEADNSAAPSPAAKESRRRWSFRRSSTQTTKTKEPGSTPTLEQAEDERTRHAMAVASATKAAADAAAAAAHAATVVIRLTEAAKCRLNTVEGGAAVKIQSVFRSYLAKKALKGLRGFVKLQALIRGQLVRRNVTVHAADRARSMAMAKEARKIMTALSRRGFNSGRSPSPLDPRCGRSTYDSDGNYSAENVKTLEMDLRGTKSNPRAQASPFYNHRHRQQQQIWPSPSALADLTLFSSSGRFEESSFRSAESSLHYHYSAMSPAEDSTTENMMYVMPNMCGSCPNYMANTESSKAKVRSQSISRQRPPSPRRLSSMESATDGY